MTQPLPTTYPKKRSLYEDLEHRINEILHEWREREGLESHEEAPSLQEIKTSTNSDLIDRASNVLREWKSREGLLQEDSQIDTQKLQTHGSDFRAKLGQIAQEWRLRDGLDTRASEKETSTKLKSNSIRTKLQDVIEDWEEREKVIVKQKSNEDVWESVREDQDKLREEMANIRKL